MIAFSRRLEKFLGDDQNRTLQDLIDNFAEKSLAILILLLMAIPALPLPTGGVTHIFEIIVMLLSLELIAGRKSVWLPKKWLRLSLPAGIRTSALPKFLKIIRWLEKYSKPRLGVLLENSLAKRILGVILLLFTVFAFLAPPFSGLDTLPSLGAVLLALAVIFEDIILALIGIAVGSSGIILIFILGKIVLKFL